MRELKGELELAKAAWIAPVSAILSPFDQSDCRQEWTRSALVNVTQSPLMSCCRRSTDRSLRNLFLIEGGGSRERDGTYLCEPSTQLALAAIDGQTPLIDNIYEHVRVFVAALIGSLSPPVDPSRLSPTAGQLFSSKLLTISAAALVLAPNEDLSFAGFPDVLAIRILHTSPGVS